MHMFKKFSWNSRSEMANLLFDEFKTRVLPVKFCGTVHCEASLMGMIVACKDDMMSLPDGVKREDLEVFKVLPNCIYMF